MKAILTYHSIDESGSPISVPADAFERHRAWITSGRVRALSLSAIVRHPDDGEDAVAVTFDDAFLNAKSPISSLAASGVPVAVFAVTHHVGTTNAWGGKAQDGIPTLPLMSWEDLRVLIGLGVEIAPHSRTHRSMTALSAPDIAAEMAGSADDLQGRLGVRSPHFAYPYGELSDAVVEQAARHFDHAFTTEFDLLTSGSQPMRCPRLDMYYFRGRDALSEWGSRRFARHLRWIQTRRWIRRLATRSPV
jgi:peptidoglycan/xylan/chitin deacetylase (PgdA/CDA1 family)